MRHTYLSTLAMFGALLVAGATHAACPVPNQLTNGTTADASQVMANFSSVAACTGDAGNITSGNLPAAQMSTNLSAALDSAVGSTQGSILYRGASGWTALSPGTAGQVLQTGGAGANPSWVAQSGGGSNSGPSDLFIPQVSFAYTANYPANYYTSRMVIMPAAATITAVKFSMGAANTTSQVAAAIYSVTATGAPGTLLASSQVQTGLSAGINILTLSSPLSVTQNEELFIGITNYGSALTVSYVPSQNGYNAYFSISSGTPPATAPVATYNDNANLYGYWVAIQ